MVTARVERRLTAILAADVAGYSRLMGADEEGTLAQLKAHRRALVDPKITEHRGRIVKTTGDGMLVEFASVVNAVRCAVDIQRGIIERNAEVSQEKRIAFRIGVNVGDIIIDGGDIFGDGVNVAARLEGLAEPGGICLSEDAWRQSHGKVPLPFVDLGPLSLKNIAEPVRVYALTANAVAALPELPPSLGTRQASQFRGFRNAWLIAGGIAVVVVAAGAWLGKPAGGPHLSPAPPRLSMVVLPFTNLSGDPAQNYVADVLTEELTSTLSRIPDSFVIARSTASTFKGKPVDVKQIGRELGVRYALEGSEQHDGNRIRVNVQLIDAETGAHLWADQFDESRADLFQTQDEIVARLSWPLQVRLIDVEAARVARTRPGNLDAQDLAMRCLSDVTNTGGESPPAYSSCEGALQIDNRNAVALALTALKHILPVLGAQSNDRVATIRLADEFASRALAIDPNYYLAHYVKAYVLMAQKRTEEAITEAERSLALYPSFVTGYVGMGIGHGYLGRPEKTIEYADKAIRLSPRDPLLFLYYNLKGWAFLMQQRDDQAIDWLHRASAGPVPITQAMLASVLALNGQEEEARDTLKHYLALSGTKSRTVAQLRTEQFSLSDNPKWLAYNERLFEGLRKAGMPEE